MDVYSVEYASPKSPTLKERKLRADDYAVHGDFVDFTTTEGTKVFSVRADAVVTITKEAGSASP
ncbi:hypothetical protein ACPMJQ_29350 [Streptomyces pseudogriseolus]|uniref:hypothetical protein n=1 Tax=Streptomyces TaxID=1883 RepID=UPI0034602D3B